MRAIDLQTTQNVTIEYELANTGTRIGSFLLDLLAFGLLFFLLTVLVDTFYGTFDSDWGAMFFYGFLPIFGLMLYHLLFEIINNGQSLGKFLLGIKVIRLDGAEPSFTDHLIRAFFLIIDFIFSMGLIGAVLMGSSGKRQRLGDLAAGTTVIKLRSNIQFRLSDILNISSLDDYEPQYPEVTQLSEQDMLFVKQTIHSYNTYRNDAHRRVVQQLVQRISEQLDIIPPRGNQLEFLRILIQDYIVLTR